MIDRFSIRSAVNTALGTAFAWLLIGFVAVVSIALFIIILPFSMVHLTLQRMAPGVFGHPGGVDPEDVAAFHAIYDDILAGDTAALEHHAKTNPEFPGGLDPFITRPWLTNAVDAGSVASVRWILERGVDPNIQDDEGQSPLISAVTEIGENTLDIVETLIAHGADPNFCVTLDRTALHAAACHGSPDVVRLLLKHGADPFAYDCDYVPARPVDDARNLKRHDVVQVLEDWMTAHAKVAKTQT